MRWDPPAAQSIAGIFSASLGLEDECCPHRVFDSAQREAAMRVQVPAGQPAHALLHRVRAHRVVHHRRAPRQLRADGRGRCAHPAGHALPGARAPVQQVDALRHGPHQPGPHRHERVPLGRHQRDAVRRVRDVHRASSSTRTGCVCGRPAPSCCWTTWWRSRWTRRATTRASSTRRRCTCAPSPWPRT